MHPFHHDRRRYFDIQVANARKSIIPFIASIYPLPSSARILEIGCGEGGLLKAFAENGHTAIGIEIEEGRVQDGISLMEEEIQNGSVRFITDDIFNIHPADLNGLFHVVILKDVIEHIADKELLLLRIKRFLHRDGVVFLGFPPWQMPFGGHQQLCRNRYLSKIPWLHLLPRNCYEFILRRFKNEPVEELLSIYDCRISIERFERLAKGASYLIRGSKHFLIAPIYEYKFGLKKRSQSVILQNLPYLRNLFTTAVYYLVAPGTVPAKSNKPTQSQATAIETKEYEKVPG